MTNAVATAKQPLLELKGITKRFPGVQALSEVSLDLRPGEVHALVGENGAGKSTLIKVMTGFHQADEGAMLIGRPAGGVLQPPPGHPGRHCVYLPGAVHRPPAGCGKEPVFGQLANQRQILGPKGPVSAGRRDLEAGQPRCLSQGAGLRSVYRSTADGGDWQSSDPKRTGHHYG